MGRALTCLWKEWRDQRGIALAVLGALPALVLGAAWAFGGKVAPPAFAALAVLAAPLAQALFLVAVASELFGAERRRGTLALLQRLPGGVVRALGAKLLAYLLGSALALLAGVLVACLACLVFGPAGSAAEALTRALDPGADPLLLGLVLGLLAFGLWVLLVGTWIPQGGAAVVGGALLIGALALPAWLALQEHGWLVERTLARLSRSTAGMLWLALGLSALPLPALLASHLGGARRLAGAWASAWRGLAVLGALAAGGYAWGGVVVARETSVTPSSEAFRIQRAIFGAGGRYAFLDVFAGEAPWVRGAGANVAAAGTPTRALLVDLADGSWRPVGGFEEGWLSASRYGSGVGATPLLLHARRDGLQVAWWDAREGRELKTVWWNLENEQTLAWRRTLAAHEAWHRDAEGRALWIEGGGVVREGDPAPRPGAGMPTYVWARPIPEGWIAMRSRVPHAGARSSLVTVEASTGRERPLRPAGSPSLQLSEPLDPRHVLRQAVRGGAYDVLDLDAPDEVREAPAPEGFRWVAGPLAGGSVLGSVGPARGPRTLVLWSPRSGGLRPVLGAEGVEPTLVDAWQVQPVGADGRLLLGLRLTPDGARTATLLLQVPPDAGAARARTLPVEGWASDYVVEPDGDVLAVELHRRVVRYPAAGGREVLFPRP